MTSLNKNDGENKSMNSYTEKSVSSYLDSLYHMTNDGRLNDPNVSNGILSLLHKACGVGNLTLPDLLDKLDFKPNSLSIEALESFLAEVRAIIWLRDFGFSDIIPLKSRKKTKQPDFQAKYKDRNSAIEVFCLTQKHGQQRNSHLGIFVNFDPQFSGSKFGRDFMAVAQQKRKQLDSVSADIRVLLCVVNSDPIVALNTREDFDKHAIFLQKKLSWGEKYYVGILTGNADTIFPKLK